MDYKISIKAFIALLGVFALSVTYAEIEVGTVPFDPPYVISRDQGFEIDLMKLICQRLGKTCDFKIMPYTELFTALQKGSIDIAIDSVPFYINSKNTPYIYSFPYLPSQGQFLIAKDSKFRTILDIPAGSEVGLVKENGLSGTDIYFQFFIHKFGSHFKIKFFDDIESLIASLSKGKITAAFVDLHEANYWASNGGEQLTKLGHSINVADGIGMVSLPSHKNLINIISKQLVKIENENTYIDLYNTYFDMGPKELS